MSQRSFKLKGWHVLAAIVLFFGIDFAVNGYFVFAATSTFPGEAVRHSYTQGIHYNDELAVREVQGKLGWHVRYNALREDDGALAVVVEVTDKAAQPLSGLHLAGILRRRGDGIGDRKLAFEPERPGVYRARLTGAPEGRWFLEGKAMDNAGHAFEFRSGAWVR